MNRLFIIGNGFDLAHGLKTRYEDFLLWYFDKKQELVNNSQNNEDRLCTFKAVNNDNGIIIKKREKSFNLAKFLDELADLNLRINYKSEFFETVVNDSKNRWVDFENTYYQFLKKTLSNDESSEKITKLNEDLDYIRKEFIAYLKESCNYSQFNVEESPFYPILKKVYSTENNISKVKNGVTDVLEESQVMFVNFNYTPLVNEYYKKLKNVEGQFKLIPIHGSIENPDSIVFGFGDELDDTYHEMENKNKNEYFKHIKSFKYFQDENYQELMTFVESDDFEVVVLGHSLGLSDRTMLSQIFEHENLERVQLYYYEDENGNDFTEKTYEISRHFSDKGRMRLKIVPLTASEAMPQVE